MVIGRFKKIKYHSNKKSMHNSVIDHMGGSINATGDLGRMSSKDILIRDKAKDIHELTNHLYFELNTSSLNYGPDAVRLARNNFS